MASVGFYHLTRTSVAAALPALLGRTLSAGQRAVVCGSAETIAALDASLWLSETPDWLPHGTDGGPFAADQPILLTSGDGVANGARYVFLLDGKTIAFAAFERVFDLFDGNDASFVEAARERWRAARAGGHELSYWKQTERGWSKER